MFKRKIYSKLEKRKKESNGKTALLIEGARRVGKSTIVREFAQNEYKSHIIIDFANASINILSIFDDISNLDLFFSRLQLETRIKLYDRKSVIIFDEIQLFPKARQAIKYLVLDGRYDYIETGSLISIKKNVSSIVIPSKESKIEMFPMDYEEFLDAIGYNYDIINNLYNQKISIGDDTNRTLMINLRLYIAIGGMPQAVESYLKDKNFEKIDIIKKNIINLYKDDLMKINKSGRLSKMFESIPAQLVSKRNKFSFGYGLNKKVKKDDERLYDLIDSKIVNCCYKLVDVSPSLSLYEDLNSYKLYVADTGLFVTMLFNSNDNSHNDIYKKLLSDKLDVNLGYLYENLIAQIIASSNKKLYYFTFPKTNSSHNYEIDFLLNRNTKIIPLEVKSNKINNHNSLDFFKIKYSKYINQKYIISKKDYFKKDDIINLPFYFVPSFLKEL